MQMTHTRRGLSDRTLNRMIIGAVVVLAIGIPLIAVIYFMDRNVDGGPSLVERQVAAGEAAVREKPNSIEARLGLATAYLTAERYPDAIAQYTEILRVSTDYRGALLGRGNAYLLSEDLANAQKDFGRLVEVAKDEEMANADPQLEESYFRLGDIALRQGRTEDAVTMLTAALRINRTDADAMNLLGTAFVSTGKPQDAVDVLGRAIALVPTGWCDPYQTLGQAYTALGNTDGATWANAMVSFCTKQPDLAKPALQGITTGEFAVRAALGLALIAQSEGDMETAAALYQKVLAAEPDNFTAISGLQQLGVASAAPAGSAAPAASPSTGANP